MVKKILSACFWFTYQSIKYIDHSLDFSFGSRLKKTNLGKEIKIGKSFVYNSKIGNKSSISDSSSIVNSEIGNKSSISTSCHIINSYLEDQVSVYRGSKIIDCSVGRFTYISAECAFSLAKIGRFCSMGPQILCGRGEHPTNFVSTHPVFFSTLKQCGTSFTDKNLFEERKQVIVGNDVWIGARVFIRDGVRIGNGAIIGAGAVVVKDVPDYAIVGGVPAKVIRFRFPPDAIEKLKNIEWWNLPEEKLREAQSLIAQENIQMFIDWYEKNAFS
ncbi:MAG: hypothetical protein RLZZ507_2856 [Cyanobacteriota bacterium]